MKNLTLVSKKEILKGESYTFGEHVIVCNDWTERGKNGSNVAAQFIGTIDGKEFKGTITALKKAVGAEVLAKAEQGSPESIFNTYISNIRNIKGLPAFYIEELESALANIEKRKEAEELADIEAQIKALQEKKKALKK